jgi:hypothetical protein
MNNHPVYNGSFNDQFTIHIGAIRAQINNFPLSAPPSQLDVLAGNNSTVKHHIVVSGASDPNHSLVIKRPDLNRDRLKRMLQD